MVCVNDVTCGRRHTDAHLMLFSLASPAINTAY